MDALLRAVRRNPNVFGDNQGQSKHKKLPEGWGENKEPVADGVTFYLKYLGSTLVEELPEDESYGDSVSMKAVQSIVALAKTAGKKLKKVSLTIRHKGIRMTDLTTKETDFDISIYRISFCTADKNHEKVFAFIARNTTNETMECHAYLCAKPKIAQAVTLTVSQAFSLAQDHWEEAKNRKSQREIEKTNNQKGNSFKCSNSSSVINSDNNYKTSSSNTNNLLSFTDSSPVTPPPVTINCQKQLWTKFSDDEDEDESFSRLAENRSRRLPSFSTNLRKEDLDDSVEQYMDGRRCFEEFSRQMSIEDLLNL
ncbi:low density lipoprotein receptor adapter protein 1-B [Patella vulgata]|uniref:low density lipoprotein receptor adapter protein 1-B n=1 Tax=Patella vulgata TaxID=6465 RepID=UPI00217FE697|nr:low density lipoprotein receptor adapter protein 1-B [Patella vulgata]